jgi:hypothetical protein
MTPTRCIRCHRPLTTGEVVPGYHDTDEGAVCTGCKPVEPGDVLWFNLGDERKAYEIAPGWERRRDRPAG